MKKQETRKNACTQLSGFATGGVCARRNIVRIINIAARANVSEPPPAAKPPPVSGNARATQPYSEHRKEMIDKLDVTLQ